MSVRFLSDEWAQALKAELNESEEFRRAAAGQHATIQQVITGGDADNTVTEELAAWVGDRFPDVELEIHAGGQPLYPYLLGVE